MWVSLIIHITLRKVNCTLENNEDLRKNSSETGETEATAHVRESDYSYNVAQSQVHPGEQEGAVQEQQQDKRESTAHACGSEYTCFSENPNWM